jgi:hypothetical protein
MVMDNLCDLSHAYLHRRFPSFRTGRLLSCESEPDRVVMRYEARVGPFAHLRRAEPRLLDIAYEYPYHRARFQWSNIEGPSRTGRSCSPWTSESPGSSSSSATTGSGPNSRRCGSGTGWCRAFLRLIQPAVRRLLGQDGFALEAEQAGWDRHFEQPIPDLNPVVTHVERLTIEKWQTYLASTARTERSRAAPATDARSLHGA